MPYPNLPGARLFGERSEVFARCSFTLEDIFPATRNCVMRIPVLSVWSGAVLLGFPLGFTCYFLSCSPLFIGIRSCKVNTVRPWQFFREVGAYDGSGLPRRFELRSSALV